MFTPIEFFEFEFYYSH